MSPFRILFLPSLLFAGALMSACEASKTAATEQPAEQARPAKIMSVLSSGISLLRSYPGTLEASKQADLAFRVGGQLIELPAQAGLRVTKGDLLARLDEAEYRNTLEERQARFDLAMIQHQQASKLLQKQLTSQLQYDQSAAELKSSKAALEQARDNLHYSSLLAPFDGIVARVDMENFQAIQAKTPIIQLQDDKRLDIRFSVPESLISQMKRIDDSAVIEGICAITRFSAQPRKTYRACYKEHESVPDVLTRNYSAVFSLEPITDFAALPGMTASIELDLSAFLPDDTAKGLLVPVESVLELDGKKWIWLVDAQMRARRTQVEIGRFEGDMLEITHGLRADNKLIAAGVSYIREGMLVKPMVKERGL